jgi:protein-tyrosine phosphatase
MLPLQRVWRRLEPLVRRGALVQLTGGSLLGDFGEPARETAERYLRKGWAHLLASDAHWADERTPRLAAAVRAAAALVGAERARALVEGNPRAVLAGEALPAAPPIR